ncbi:MAG: YgfZ/GcvT domain-containing protein [Micromonosporaceae bacterium]
MSPVGLPRAVLADGIDAGVAAHYGDPLPEQRRLAEAAGVVDRGNRGVVAVSGPERLSWLHNITTQHLTGLAAYQGTELLVLSPHGHVEHHAVVVDDGETTWLDTEPDAAAGLLDFLERMKFFAQVELRDATAERAVVSLVGPDAALPGIALAAPDVLPVPGAKFATGAVPERATSVYAAAALPDGGIARRMPGDRIDLLLPRAAAADFMVGCGAPASGIWAYEALRVASRTARLGLDTDHRTLPHEVDLLATAVHLEKGCYRGQETVARVHNLGRPPRRLVLLHLDGSSDHLPPSGSDISADGRRIGYLGTAVHHYELGGIALAVLKRSVSDGAALEVGEVAAAIDA